MANGILSDGFISLCVNTDSNVYGTGCKILVEGAMIAKPVAPSDTGGGGSSEDADKGTIASRASKALAAKSAATAAVIAKPKYQLRSGKIIPFADNDDSNIYGNAIANEILEITNERQIETAFGRGSILSTTLKTVLCTCPTAQIFALPRADETGATKAEYIYSITAENGAATTNGRVMIYFGDKDYMIDFAVKIGDDAASIAGKIKDSLPNDFPYDIEIVSGGSAEKTQLKFTAKNTGTIGNYLLPVYNWPGRADTAPGGITMALDTLTEGTDGAFIGDYANEVGECCYDCYILSSTNQVHRDALRDHISKNWDCNEGQCFGHGYVVSAGTPEEILSTFDNSAELSILAWPTDYSPALPYLVNAAYGAASCCSGCERPEVSIQGRQNGLLSCLKVPQSCSSSLSRNDKNLLKENGFVVASPVDTGLGGLTSLFIENDITNYLYDTNGRDNATYRSTSSRRLAKATALALAQELQDLNGLSLFTRNTMIGAGVKGITVPMIEGRIRSFAKANVGVLFSEFDDVSDQIQLQTDFEVQPKCQGRPGILHLNFAYRAPERLESIATTVTPRLIDNCN